MQSLSVVHTFLAHQEGTTSVSFSPDGTTLASGGYDCSIRLWDVTTGKQNLAHSGHRRGHVAFSPDGRSLVSGGLHRDAVVYDTASWQVMQTLAGTSTAWDVAFTSDGQHLAIVQPNTPVQMWDTRTWQGVEHRAIAHAYIYALAFAPDDDRLAVAIYEQGRIRILNHDFTQEIAAFSPHQPATWGMSFAPNGKLLATAGADNAARFWNTTDWSLEGETWDAHSVLCVAFSPDGHLIAMGNLHGIITVFSYEG